MEKVMKIANPLARVFRDLTVQEILNYFSNHQSYSVSKLPAVKPKGGDLFLYCVPQDSTDWRTDGYRWFQNGTKFIPKKNPSIKKIYFFCVLPTGNDKRFRRLAYIPTDNQTDVILVHYLGDQDIAVDYPHRNSSHFQPYFRTLPSVLNELKKNTDFPGNTYKKALVSNSPQGCEHIIKPRNRKQIANLQQRERQKSRLTHDALYNVHELAHDISALVISIKTFPDVLIVCGHSTLADDLNRLLQTESDNPQLLSYDTTFQLGDFYLSVFLYRHTTFSSSPVIPCFFLIHERKFQFCHEELMREIAKRVPSLVSGKVEIPLVTDEESGIFQAIGKYLPKAKRIRCWNHTINAVKRWLRNHGATSTEIPAYISHLRDLLNQTSRVNYENKLKEFKKYWSQAFTQYYMTMIHSEMGTTLGRFVLEPLKVYHPFTGVTSNQSESFNATIKRLQGWREVPIDSILLTLYHAQAYFHNEIQRGFIGVGNYHLCQRFIQYTRSPEDIQLLQTYSPDEIVEMIMLKKKPEMSLSQQNCNQDKLLVNDSKDHKVGEIFHSSQQARAKQLISNNCICHNPSLGTFTVQGTNGTPHAVKLFLKESCSCPATTRCYHIIAARCSIGLDKQDNKKKINLTQLRKNMRSRSEKLSGRKAPRPGDYELSPAPDSIASQEKKANESEQILDSAEKKAKKEQDYKSMTCNFTSQVDVSVMPPIHAGKKRKRCGSCDGCQSVDCTLCVYCLDKPKFGGPNLLRQSCLKRKCKKFNHSGSIEVIPPITDNSTMTEPMQEKKIKKSRSLKLTTEQKKRVESELSKKDDEKVTTINGYDLYLMDLKTLCNTTWLNDKVIDAYCALICQKCNFKSPNTVLTLSCFFYQKLNLSGFEAVSRWIKIGMTFHKLLIPINTSSHWRLVVVDTMKKEIKCYDSMLGNDDSCIYSIKDFLSQKYTKENFSAWKLWSPKNIPRQNNGYDCGVFTCMYARHEGLETSLSFHQIDIPSIRENIMYEFCTKTLLDY